MTTDFTVTVYFHIFLLFQYNVSSKWILNQQFISSESILFPLDFTSKVREHRLHTSNIDSVSSNLIECPSRRHNGHKLELLTSNSI